MSQALLADPVAYLDDLMAFLDASPTPFHAVGFMARRLEQHGFHRLCEAEPWQLEHDGSYFVTRGGAIIAFTGNIAARGAESGIRAFGAHTDSPNLRLRPQPLLQRDQTLQFGLDCYGGLLMAPWFDRDLGLAGQVIGEDEQGRLRAWLLRSEGPVAVIPSLAIHLDREANNNRSINPQKELVAVLAIGEEGADWPALLGAQIRREHGEVPAILHSWELSLFDCQPAARVGLYGDLLCSARLDNLLSCHAGLVGLCAALQAGAGEPVLLVCNDHEEVGSMSVEGASGPFLEQVISRACLGDTDRQVRTLRRSFLCSADNAHGLHPNYSDRHDAQHAPRLNGGPVLKINANQRYATRAPAMALVKRLAAERDIPLQQFVTRADLACGSTIGPLTATRLGIQTIDLGVAQWAMHSLRESCGSEDPLRLARLAEALFSLPTRELAMMHSM